MKSGTRITFLLIAALACGVSAAQAQTSGLVQGRVQYDTGMLSADDPVTILFSYQILPGNVEFETNTQASYAFGYGGAFNTGLASLSITVDGTTYANSYSAGSSNTFAAITALSTSTSDRFVLGVDAPGLSLELFALDNSSPTIYSNASATAWQDDVDNLSLNFSGIDPSVFSSDAFTVSIDQNSAIFPELGVNKFSVLVDSYSVVPEPSQITLLMGLGGLILCLRRSCNK
jgi:hypothetical protein